MALAFVFLSAALIASIAGDSLLERGATAVKDLTRDEQSAEPASADEWRAADGRSNLPGGLATMSFTPLPDQRELVRSRSVDAPHDGSQWFVSMPDSSETRSNYAVLAYYVFKPPLDTDAAMREARAAEQRNASNMAADPIVFKTIEVDGRRADEFRFTMPGGDRALRVWIFGPVHVILQSTRTPGRWRSATEPRSRSEIVRWRRGSSPSRASCRATIAADSARSVDRPIRARVVATSAIREHSSVDAPWI